MADPNPAGDLELYRAYFEASTNGFFIYDQQGKLVDVNPAACRMHGYSREELLGMDPHEFIPPESHPVFQAFRETLSRGEAFMGEARGVRRDGSHFDVEIQGQRITVGDRQLFFSSLIDVTERKQLADQLRHAQRMEAIGQLAGGVAHDFNNLLSVILGYSELIQARLADEALLRDLEAIKSAGLRARDLVQHLLAYSRRQTLSVTLTDLNEFVAEQAKTLARLLPATIELRVVPSQEDTAVRIDRAQLEQVILNMAVNAQHALPEGGVLVLELSRVVLDEDYARRHDEVRHGPHVMLSISDDGVGMDAETQARVFEPFFTTKGRGIGTGLGLSMVYGILKQHGGHVSVYSEVGQGTTFKLYIPASTEGQPLPKRPASGPLHRGTERILVVEDSRAVRDLAARLLIDAGYQVWTAADGQSALDVTAGVEDLDLLLSDVILPGLNGRQVYERLLERFPELKVVYMSGYTENVVSHQGLLDPDVLLIQKPFKRKALATILRRAFGEDPA